MRRLSRAAPAVAACVLLIAIVSGCAMLGFETPDSALTEYLRLQPADASGYVALGKAYLQTGDRADALNALFKALQLNPSMSGVEELMRGLR